MPCYLGTVFSVHIVTPVVYNVMQINSKVKDKRFSRTPQRETSQVKQRLSTPWPFFLFTYLLFPFIVKNYYLSKSNPPDCCLGINNTLRIIILNYIDSERNKLVLSYIFLIKFSVDGWSIFRKEVLCNKLLLSRSTRTMVLKTGNFSLPFP